MFGIGAGEFVLIIIVGLIVFGPSKLPEFGRSVGKLLREFRKAQAALSTTLNDLDNDSAKPSNSASTSSHSANSSSSVNPAGSASPATSTSTLASASITSSATPVAADLPLKNPYSSTSFDVSSAGAVSADDSAAPEATSISGALGSELGSTRPETPSTSSKSPNTNTPAPMAQIYPNTTPHASKTFTTQELTEIIKTNPVKTDNNPLLVKENAAQ